MTIKTKLIFCSLVIALLAFGLVAAEDFTLTKQDHTTQTSIDGKTFLVEAQDFGPDYVKIEFDNDNVIRISEGEVVDVALSEAGANILLSLEDYYFDWDRKDHKAVLSLEMGSLTTVYELKDGESESIFGHTVTFTESQGNAGTAIQSMLGTIDGKAQTLAPGAVVDLGNVILTIEAVYNNPMDKDRVVISATEVPEGDATMGAHFGDAVTLAVGEPTTIEGYTVLATTANTRDNNADISIDGSETQTITEGYGAEFGDVVVEVISAQGTTHGGTMKVLLILHDEAPLDLRTSPIVTDATAPQTAVKKAEPAIAVQADAEEAVEAGVETVVEERGFFAKILAFLFGI